MYWWVITTVPYQELGLLTWCITPPHRCCNHCVKIQQGCVVGVSLTKKLSQSLLQTGVCSLVPATVSHQWWYSVQQRFLLFNTACMTCNARKQPSACLEYRRIGRYPIYFHPLRRPESGLTISSLVLFFPCLHVKIQSVPLESKKIELGRLNNAE